MTYSYNGEIYVDGVTVEVEAKGEGFYCEEEVRHKVKSKLYDETFEED